jgi:hypothetical protein
MKQKLQGLHITRNIHFAKIIWKSHKWRGPFQNKQKYQQCPKGGRIRIIEFTRYNILKTDFFNEKKQKAYTKRKYRPFTTTKNMIETIP